MQAAGAAGRSDPERRPSPFLDRPSPAVRWIQRAMGTPWRPVGNSAVPHREAGMAAHDIGDRHRRPRALPPRHRRELNAQRPGQRLAMERAECAARAEELAVDRLDHPRTLYRPARPALAAAAASLWIEPEIGGVAGPAMRRRPPARRGDQPRLHRLRVCRHDPRMNDGQAAVRRLRHLRACGACRRARQQRRRGAAPPAHFAPSVRPVQ